MNPMVVLGLGNPGAEYADTRHNVGFQVVDLLGSRLGVRFTRHTEFFAGETRAEGMDLLLVMPMLYMNNSGTAAARIEAELSVGPASFLVVHDDAAIPLGTIRLRARGSDGGHNGLRSVIEAFGTEELPRLRCGIRQAEMPPGHGLRDFVLSPFDREELPIVRAMVGQAAEAVMIVARSGVERAMNVVNA